MAKGCLFIAVAMIAGVAILFEIGIWASRSPSSRELHAQHPATSVADPVPIGPVTALGGSIGIAMGCRVDIGRADALHALITTAIEKIQPAALRELRQRQFAAGEAAGALAGQRTPAAECGRVPRVLDAVVQDIAATLGAAAAHQFPSGRHQ